jgi:hypothetical protein
MKKCLFIILFLVSTALAAFSQPTITVQREGSDGNYSTSPDIYGDTINVLAGETMKLKIVISETSPGDFLDTTNYTGNYGKLVLSTASENLLNRPGQFVYSSSPSDGDVIEFWGASYEDNNEQEDDLDKTAVENWVKVDSMVHNDTITIKKVELTIPTELTYEDIFSLKLEEDFINEIENPTLLTFEYTTPNLTVTSTEKACPGENVRFSLSVTPDSLEYNLDTNGVTTDTKVKGSKTLSFPKDIEVKVVDPDNEHSKDTASNTVIIDNDFFLSMDTYSLEQSISLPYNKGRINMFERFSDPVFEYDSLYADSDLSEKVYGKSENYDFAVKNRKDGKTNDYTFGRFHFEYNDSDYSKDDSTFNTEAEEINYGAGNTNKVTFHYGKYFVEEEKTCIDSAETDIEVVKNKVFITKSTFCSTDDKDYKFEIDTSVEFNSIDANHFYNHSFKEYYLRDPVTGTEYRSGNEPTDSINPYELWENEGTGNSLPVEIVAVTEVNISPKPTDCPDQWSDEYTGDIYHKGDQVSYRGKIYEAAKDISHKQTDSPDDADYWDKQYQCIIYDKNDKVMYQDKIYKATKDLNMNQDAPPSQASYWEKVQSCIIYYEGSFASYNEMIYKATEDLTMNQNTPPSQASYWEYTQDCITEITPPDERKVDERKVDEQKSENVRPSLFCDRIAWDASTPDGCNKPLWNPNQTPSNCGKPEWNPNRTPDPIYNENDSVTFNGIIYKCMEKAYVNDIPSNSDRWKSIGPCEESESSDTTTITYEYASKIINIYKPKSNFTLNLSKKHCITNREINLNSNYKIDTIENHKGSIKKSGNEWIFTPEQLVEDGENKKTANLKFIYTDEHSCQSSSSYEIEVAKSNGLHPPFSFDNELDTVYCEIDKDFNLSGRYTIDKLSGPGIRKENGSYLFNPDSALNDNSSDTLIEFSLDYRDQEGCKYDSAFHVRVYDNPMVSFDYENLCIGDYTKYTDTIEFLGSKDSLTRKWSFGDYQELKHLGPDSIQEGTHNDNTRGTYSAPEHRYEEPGKYSVSLQVSSQEGCSDKVTDTITIGKYPKVDFSADGYIKGRRTAFYNSTKSAPFDTVVSYTWDFDDKKAFSDLEKTRNRNTSYTFKTPGVHDVRLTAVTNNGCQSGKTVKVPVFPLITVNDSNYYQERFENTSGGWLNAGSYNEGENGGWSLEPVEGRYKREEEKGKMWLTASPDDDNGDEHSWVESPVFNIDKLSFPLLSVDIYQSVEEGRDGAVLQYSLDDGDTWKLLGRMDEGLGWYNNTGIVSNPGDQEGTGNIGWSANNNQWQTARFPLDSVRQASRNSYYPGVRFRMSYSSDNGNAEGLELNGFGFDNFMVSQRSRIVMLEQFINSAWDKEMQVQEEAWMDEFVENRKEEVVDMRYHTKLGFQADPLFYLNWQDISARAGEYGASIKQMTVVDGLYKCEVPAEEEVSHYYRKRALVDKRFDIDVDLENDGDSLYVTATVRKLVDSLPVKISQRSCVRMAILQKEYEHEGELYKNVMVDLLPTNVGNLAGIVPADASVNEPVTVTQSWGPDLTTIGNDFRLVVYVQNIDGMDNIHQVWFTDLEEEMVPQVEVDDPFKYDYFLNTPDEEHLSEVQFYPMPVNDKLQIEWKKPVESEMRWELMSVNGQVLRQGTMSKGTMRKTIDMTSVAEGSYIVVLFNETNQRVIKRKIIISR